MHRRLLPLLAVAATLVVPTGAHAAEVSLPTLVGGDGNKDPTYELASLRVTDAVGADDTLAVSFAGRVVRVTGSPAPTPGPGCVADGPQSVRCTPGDPAVEAPSGGAFDLGGGDDALTLTGASSATVTGGPGADELSVDGGQVRWDGGQVRWDGGPGADSVQGARVTHDYSSRTAGISVTFDGVANDGEPGEGDDVGSLGDVIGGAGPDSLQAGRGGSSLDGGSGDDRLVGGDGADELRAGPGDDVLDGGAGDDRLVTTDGAATDVDQVHGGAGSDHGELAIAPRPLDVLPQLRLGASTAMPAPGAPAVDGVEDVHLIARRVRLVGTAGDDRLDLLSSAPSVLDGGSGDDHLRSGGGDAGTRMVGGPGQDVITATTPLDELDLRDGERDIARCSEEGLLRRPHVDAVDRLSRCGAPVAVTSGVALLRGRTFQVELRCPRVTPEPCRGSLELPGRDTPQDFAIPGSVRFEVPRGATRRVGVPTGPVTAERVRRSLARGEAVGLTVEVHRHLRGQRGFVFSDRPLRARLDPRATG